MKTISQPRLGRGLEALIAGGARNITPAVSAQTPLGTYRWLPITAIAPNAFQPRKTFDPIALDELAASIRQEGLIQPVVVRQIDGERYELIAGERRWRACQQLGHTEIPAIVSQANNAQAATWALVENIQREALSAIDEALALESLINDFDLTQEDVAQRIGKGRASVANTLRLLHLEPSIQNHVRDGRISVGHAKVLLGVNDTSARQQLAEETVRYGLSVRSLELRTALVRTPKYIREQTPLEVRLSNHLGAKTKITTAGGKEQHQRGKMIIAYNDETQLQRILKKMGL